MKIKLPEHDHKLTNLLKVLLFSLLMLLPFLDIGTRCGYVLLNKNAYQSYSKNEVTNQIQVSDTAQLGNGFEYNIKFTRTDNVFSGQNSVRLKYTNITINWEDYGAPSGYNYDAFQTFKTTSGNPFFYLYLYENNVNVHTFWNVEHLLDLDFNIILADNYTLTGNEVYYVHNNFTTTQTLDNVFDYSIDKMANSPLYNWTTQTGMYTGVNAMTTGLGITTPLFAILITYWMFLTIIYIILDIVLTLMTKLTHIFTKEKD